MKNKNAALLSCLALLAQNAAMLPSGTVFAAENTGKLFINEVCAKNTEFAAPDGNHYDWIELYNASSSALDISGYGITDDETKPGRFTFPDGTSIAAGEHLLVFCNSGDFSIADSHCAVFGISTDGETITLTDRNGGTVDTVTFGSIEANQSYGRTKDGTAEYGYMQMTPGSANKADSVVKKDVPAPVFSQASGYISGSANVTITAQNNAKIYYTVDGSAPTVSSKLYSSAIEVSKAALEAIREEAAANAEPETPEAQNPDPWGPGQNPWGGNNPNQMPWGGDIAFAPGDANEAENPWGGIGGGFPEFGDWGNMGDWGNGGFGGDWGFGNWGGVSIKAGAPEAQKDAFVIRAIAVDSEGNASAPVTATYFLGIQDTASYYSNLKVFSLATDSANLNDSQTGIYKNPNQTGREWERPVSVQIFEGGKEVFAQNAGIRIHGGYTRSFAQKSFNLYARDEYGASKFDFDLFSGALRSEETGKKIKKFDSFILRNAGNDCDYARFRDKLNQNLVSDRNFLQQAMEPAVVFLNGEYFGHYEITEKLSTDYINDHTGVKKSDICIIKNQELEDGDEETYREYQELGNWIKQTDFSVSSNYQQLCSKIDIDCFIDYMSAQIFFGNKDWGKNNVALWKTVKPDETNPYADGKWRFILFDTEYSANLYNQIPASTNTLANVMREGSWIGTLLSQAMKNDEFRQKFATAFMDMANYNFDNKKINSLISEYSAVYKPLAVDTFAKFRPENNETSFNSAVETITAFYKDRYESVTGSLRTSAGLTGSLVSVTVSNDSSKGTVKVNTLTPDMSSGSYTGKYYSDYPVTVSAESKEGYTFAGWKLADGTVIKSAEAEIPSGSGQTITATYTAGGASSDSSTASAGDVNADGTVNSKDLAALAGYFYGKSASVSKTAADVNKDGKVNISDIIALKAMLLK